jgi:hypothetical protein
MQTMTGFDAMNTFGSDNAHYYAYLLRLRYMDNGGRPCWVYSLESPNGVEHYEFQTMQALAGFLARQTLLCVCIHQPHQPDQSYLHQEHDESQR